MAHLRKPGASRNINKNNPLYLIPFRKNPVFIVFDGLLPFSKWEQIFKNPMNAAAAIDQLAQQSVILEPNIERYRMEVDKNSGNECFNMLR